ncbi:MAG: hypothetical protein ACPGGB_11185 [Flavobacteriales bacterium]
MSAKTVKMLDTVEDSHILTDPEEMKVPAAPGHAETKKMGKRDRIISVSRVGKFLKGGTYKLPASQADELVFLNVAQEAEA